MAKIESAKPISHKFENPAFNVWLKPENDSYDIVVFCHLRWEFVYQRPQHIISRLAREHRVLLIEEPIAFDEGEKNTGSLLVINDNLHLLQARTDSIDAIKDVLFRHVPNRKIPVGWFYSPAFIPLLDYFSFDTVVYDCMDELTLFKGASPALQDQEQQLMRTADVIFTGGKSLYESKCRRHDNVHCFPSSVDQPHFAGALNEQPVPEDLCHIRTPVAGYFGVLDERIDFGLLEATAQLEPEVAFVMVGPLAKISERDLPRRPNIHYPGMKAYTALPAYLRVFDIAIMPFALNEATRFISPTKTLEYMAAGKPVISTAIRDVVRDYSHCVHIVATPAEFSNAIRSVLQTPLPMAVHEAYATILSNTSWDSTVARMQSLVSERVPR